MVAYALFITAEVSAVIIMLFGLLSWPAIREKKQKGRAALLMYVLFTTVTFGIVFLFVGKCYHIL